jgi:hypothetical protein
VCEDWYGCGDSGVCAKIKLDWRCIVGDPSPPTLAAWYAAGLYGWWVGDAPLFVLFPYEVEEEYESGLYPVC